MFDLDVLDCAQDEVVFRHEEAPAFDHDRIEKAVLAEELDVVVGMGPVIRYGLDAGHWIDSR